MGEVGKNYGQLKYAVVKALVGTKGAGLAPKGAKVLIEAQRLVQVAAKVSNWMSKLKAGALGLMKVGRKPIILYRESLEGVEKSISELIEIYLKKEQLTLLKKEQIMQNI